MKSLFDNFQTVLLPSVSVTTPLAIYIGEGSILKTGTLATAAANTSWEWTADYTPMNLHVVSPKGMITTKDYYLEKVSEESWLVKRAESDFFADEDHKKFIATTDNALLNTKGFQLLIKIDDDFINGYRSMYNHNIRTNDYLIK